MLKKEFLGLPVYYFLFIICLALLAIIFGSFFDYQFSQAIVTQGTGFGRFIESYGMMISYFMITAGGVLIFKGLYKSEKIAFKIIGYTVLVLAVVATIYFIADGCQDNETQKAFGLPLPKVGAYIFASIVSLLFTFLSYFFFQSDDKELLIRIGIAILVAMFLQWITIHYVKRLNGRPRYRYLIDSNLNPTGEAFRNWWVFKPGTAVDDLHKSWPSGHTGCAVITVLLPLLAPVLRFPFKNARFTLYCIGAGYTIIVAFMRIFHGAHFLSDVGFGALIGCLLSLLSTYLCYRLFPSKKENKSEAQKE